MEKSKQVLYATYFDAINDSLCSSIVACSNNRVPLNYNGPIFLLRHVDLAATARAMFRKYIVLSGLSMTITSVDQEVQIP